MIQSKLTAICSSDRSNTQIHKTDASEEEAAVGEHKTCMDNSVADTFLAKSLLLSTFSTPSRLRII